MSVVFFSISCSKKNPQPAKYQLHLNINQDQLILDPRKVADYSSASVQFLLFEGLVRMTPYATKAPALAERVDISEDQTKYTFHLREAFWSNGTPVTAYDFVQTWKDILNPKFPSPNAHLLYSIKNAEKVKLGQISDREIGIRALNHKTIEVYLEQPTPYFLDTLSFAIFHPVNQCVATRNSKWAEAKECPFISNGAFRLKEWKQGYYLILEKNPYYWDAKNIELEEIHISLVNSEQTALKLYEKGELDFIGLPFTGIVSDSIPDLMDKGLIKTTSLPASTICCFNMETYPFHNKNIRKAFAYAINRREIIDNVTQLGEDNGICLLPKALGFDSQPFFEDGDTERAQEFFAQGLNELGITREELGCIKLLHASCGVYPMVAQALQTQWLKNLGVLVRLEGYEYKVFLDKLTKRDYQMGQCVWIAQYLDPMNILERFRNNKTLKNYPGYNNPDYESILDSSLQISDTNQRFQHLKKAEAILVDDMPLTAIYHWKNAYMIKDYIQDFRFNPAGGYFFESITVNQEMKNQILANLNQ